MKVAIVGTGYVGLVTGACLANIGHEVLCIDNNEEKIRVLEEGGIPIYEPGLDELVKKNVEEGRLQFSTSVKQGVDECEIIFVAVSTPPLPDGSADLCFVEAVSKEIAENMKDYRIIVSKSTVPVKTSEWIKKTVDKYVDKGVEYDVASNPEFLREGKAIDDFSNPDRVVIGAESDRAKEIMAKLYEPIKDKTVILMTNIASAELIKHASNSFLALKISYINAVANICEKTDADVKEVSHGMGLDKRIGTAFLEAGAGFGGSCFPKDLSAFIKIAEKLGYDFELLRQVQEINKKQSELMVEKVKSNFMTLHGKKICVLGLAFKPDTDDMRSAPSINIIKDLVKEGAQIQAYDPVAMENAKASMEGAQGSISYWEDMYEAMKDCDALLILTDWQEFKDMDINKVKETLIDPPIIIDGRNIFEPADMEKLGIKYIGVGR
ncbi:UDP-glucose dehydrogenase family protein [Elusimicrobiota bacterium]